MSFFPKFTARLLPIPPEHLRHIKKTKNRRQKKMDDYAIEFAEWIATQGYKEYSNGWAKLWDKGLYTINELLEIFKKEKGL